jgi:uncharacterized protein (TIGR03545 family)
MTTSTTESNPNSEEQENKSPEEQKKKPKKQGPIRTGLVVALVLFGVLSWAYGKFFLDSNLRSVIEIAGTSINGAEVNVDSVKTSFFGGSFELRNLQVTDKEMPERNSLQIGAIKFHFMWDALLRAKFVVDESSVEDIQIYSARKNPGRVVPIEEAKEEGGASKQLAELEQAVLDQGKKEFEGNALGDIANLLDGGDPADQLKSIKEELYTEKKIKEYEDMIKTKEDSWKADIAKLKQVDELKKVSKDLKGFKFNKKRPDKSLKELGKVLKTSKNKVKSFNDAYKRIKSDVKNFSAVPKQIDQWIKQDKEALQSRFKIPDVNVGDLSKQLFAKMFLSKLGEYRKYVEMAHEYMPPSKEEKIAQAKKEGKSDAEIKEMLAEKKPKAKARRGGVNYKFKITTGYPLFWLKKSVLSSKSSDSQTSGDVEGVFENFTTDPKVVGKVATISLKGDFPHQKVMGVKANVVIDRLQSIPKETVNATVASYPVGEQLFSKSEKLKFGFQKAQGQLALDMISSEGKVESELTNFFTDVDYVVDSSSNTVKQMFTNVANGVGRISVNANATGAWDDLDWKIKSNLGDRLSTGLKSEVQAKINGAKKKLNDMIEQRVGGKKKALMAKANAAKAKVNGVLDKKKSEVKKIESKVVGDVNNQKKKGKKSGKAKAKKAAKKLFKKFKF